MSNLLIVFVSTGIAAGVLHWARAANPMLSVTNATGLQRRSSTRRHRSDAQGAPDEPNRCILHVQLMAPDTLAVARELVRLQAKAQHPHR